MSQGRSWIVFYQVYKNVSITVERPDTKSCRINSGYFDDTHFKVACRVVVHRDFLSNVLTLGIFHPDYGSKKQQTRRLLSQRVLLQVAAQCSLLALFLHVPFLRVSLLGSKVEIGSSSCGYSWWHLSEWISELPLKFFCEVLCRVWYSLLI